MGNRSHLSVYVKACNFPKVERSFWKSMMKLYKGSRKKNKEHYTRLLKKSKSVMDFGLMEDDFYIQSYLPT